MVIYYSGFGGAGSDPEVALPARGRGANLMLSYVDSVKKPHPRMAAVRKARLRTAPKTKGA